MIQEENHETCRHTCEEILVFYKDLNRPGGVPYETRSLLSALTRRGIRVAAVADATPKSSRRLSVRSNRPRILTDFSSSDDQPCWATYNYGLAGILAALRDHTNAAIVLIGCRRLEYLPLVLLAHMSGRRSVILAHGHVRSGGHLRGWGGRHKRLLTRQAEVLFNQLVQRPTLRFAHVCRALSASEADALLKAGARRVTVFPDAVDKSWISETLVRQFKRPGELSLAYIGRPEDYQKGLDLFIRAARKTEEGIKLELVLAGPNPEAFQVLVKKEYGDIPENIKIMGEVSQDARREILSNAHFFVHTSRYEGMAKSVREAVACGLPVIASVESNFGDWLRREQMGLACNCTVDSISKAIYAAAGINHNEWVGLSTSAMHFARTWTWDLVAERVEEAIRERPNGAYLQRGRDCSPRLNGASAIDS